MNELERERLRQARERREKEEAKQETAEAASEPEESSKIQAPTVAKPVEKSMKTEEKGQKVEEKVEEKAEEKPKEKKTNIFAPQPTIEEKKSEVSESDLTQAYSTVRDLPREILDLLQRYLTDENFNPRSTSLTVIMTAYILAQEPSLNPNYIRFKTGDEKNREAFEICYRRFSEIAKNRRMIDENIAQILKGQEMLKDVAKTLLYIESFDLAHRLGARDAEVVDGLPNFDASSSQRFRKEAYEIARSADRSLLGKEYR